MRLAHFIRVRRRRLRIGVIAVVAVLAATLSTLALSATSNAISPVGLTGYEIVTGPSTDVGNGQSAGAYIYCPVGKTAVSAGVVSHSPLTFTRILQPQDSRSWLVFVTNTATLAYTEHFQAYAVCVDDASVPGYRVVSTAAVDVGSPGGAVADAYCNSTEYAIGGGVFNHNPNSYASILRPTDDNQGWQAFVYNTASLTYSENFTVYAVCIPRTDVSSYDQHTRPYGDYGTLLTNAVPGSDTALTNTGASPYCPAGEMAVGGGTANHDQTNGFISSTYPSSDGKYWLETSTNVNPPSSYPESSLPTVVCVSATTTPTMIATTTTLAASTTTPAVNQTVTLTATVTPQSGSGTPSGTVTFYDGSTAIGTAPVVGGVATLNTSFGGGSHSLTAAYSGDSSYLPSTSDPLVITVACTSTITGTHSAVVATSGTICLANAHITGGISVGRGVTLDVEGSTVSGSISAGSPAGIRICGSNTGSIVISGASGFVRVGDPTSNCAPNTINGALTAAGNTGGGTISGNTIAGSWTIVNNVPAFTVSGNHH